MEKDGEHGEVTWTSKQYSVSKEAACVYVHGCALVTCVLHMYTWSTEVSKRHQRLASSVGQRQVGPGAHWPAGRAEMAASGTARGPVSRQEDVVLRDDV